MIFGLLKLAGLMLFLYILWRNLRDDYKEDDLIAYGWAAVAAILVVGRLSYGIVNWGVWNDSWIDWVNLFNKTGFNYVGAVAGFLLVSWHFCRDNEWKIWPLMEKVTGMSYLALSFYSLLEGWWIWSGIFLFAALLAKYISSKYRSFVWYKSGKKGFVFFFVNLIVGFVSGLLSWWLKNGPIVVIAYLMFGLISAIGLVMLANDEN